MTSDSSSQGSLWIETVAVALGAVLLLYMSSGFFAPERLHLHGQFVDQAEYVLTARDWAKTGELQSALIDPEDLEQATRLPHMPGQYALLAASYLAFGYENFASLLPSLVAFVLVCIGIYVMGRRLYGPEVGLAAALLFSLFPSSQLFAFTAMPEMTFAAAGVTACVILMLLKGHQRAWFAPWLVALLFLFRTTGALYVLPFTWVVWRSTPTHRAARALGTLAGSAALVWILAQGLLSLGIDWQPGPSIQDAWVPSVEARLRWEYGFQSPPPTESEHAFVRRALNFHWLLSQQTRPTRLPRLQIELILAATMVSLLLGWIRRRTDPWTLGIASLSVVATFVLFLWGDLYGQRGLRALFFLYPLLALSAASLLSLWAREQTPSFRRTIQVGLVCAGGIVLYVSQPLYALVGQRLQLADGPTDLATRELERVGHDDKRLLIAHPYFLGYVLEHEPVRWCALPDDSDTLYQVLERLDPHATVLIPEQDLRGPLSSLHALRLFMGERIVFEGDTSETQHVVCRRAP